MNVHNIIFASQSIFGASWLTPAHSPTRGLPAGDPPTPASAWNSSSQPSDWPNSVPGVALDKALPEVSEKIKE